eukprot:gene30135-7743_t
MTKGFKVTNINEGAIRRTGTVQANDLIIAVNDKSVAGIEHDKMVEIMKASGLNVRFTLRRKPHRPSATLTPEKTQMLGDSDYEDEDDEGALSPEHGLVAEDKVTNATAEPDAKAASAAVIAKRRAAFAA